MSKLSIQYLIRVLPQFIVPHHWFSKQMHKATRIKNRRIKNFVIKNFVKQYNVDLTTAKEENALTFSCFNDFFTRSIKPESRPIDTTNQSIVSPVDGVISQFGNINKNTLIQAKGRNYKLADLLGTNKWVNDFTDGLYMTIYLSPRDYHRIHCPAYSELVETTYIPGRLFAVNPITVSTVSNIFSRNERVVNIFKTSFGQMAVISVGAFFVGSIETKLLGEITPPHKSNIKTWQHGATPEYYKNYILAKKAGVNFLAYRCDISSKKILIDKKIKIIND